MSDQSKIGTGLTFSGCGITDAEILDCPTLFDIQRKAIQTSHMGTTGGHTFIPGKLHDAGELTLEIKYDGTQDPTLDDDAPSSCTIGGSLALTFDAFVTGFSGKAPFEDLCRATIKLKISGSIGPTSEPGN